MPSRDNAAAEQFYTVKDVAGFLKVCSRTIHRAIQSGDLQAIRIGNRVRISRESLDRYLNANRT